MFNFLKFLTGASEGALSPKQYHETFKASDRPHVLIDVRTREEFKGGHIPGAINIDVQEIDRRLSEIPRDKAVVLYCRSGNRSSIAAGILRRAGFTEVYDLGGIGDWQAAGYPVKR